MGRLKNAYHALLASADSDPQARDSRHDTWAASDGYDIETPDRAEIENWVEEYKANPLIHVPVDKFASDVSKPGYRVDVETEEDEEIPTVTESHDEYSGMDLDEALEEWLSESAIIAGEFNRDFGDLIDDIVKDTRGRRGTALIEHAYDDRKERNKILGLRLFKSETVTAYTRPGKAILLKEDDGRENVDVQHARGAGGDASRTYVPKTEAGNTAAYVQYDDHYSTVNKDEVALAQTDVTKIVHNADTGQIFGEPESAMVYEPAKGVREQIAQLKKGLMGKMFGYWIAQVGTYDEPVSKSKGKDLVADMDLNDPTSKTAVPYQVEAKQFPGEVPDVENVFSFQVEYVLSAFSTPIYRIGFAGDINRDISTEQKEDYRDEVQRERDKIASAFWEVLQRKANELMGDDPFDALEDGSAPTVCLSLEPEQDESPLVDEHFDATQFRDLMQGLEMAAPGGEVSMVMPPEAIVEKLLKMDPEEIIEMAPQLDDELDEDDEEAEAMFSALKDVEPVMSD